MSPSSSSSCETNHSRPARLKIQRDSNTIQKTSTSSSSSTTTTTTNHHDRQSPVIIYTHSPKIIHTEARDFMALVQKLTGFSPPNDTTTNNNNNNNPNNSIPPPPPPPSNKICEDHNYNANGTHDINMGTSSISSNSMSAIVHDSPSMSTSEPLSPSPMTVALDTSSCLPEIPCSASDFFYSEMASFMYPDSSVLSSPSMDYGWIHSNPTFGYGDQEDMYLASNNNF